MRAYELLKTLSDGRFYSGQSLGEQFNISRTAVWNDIQAIRDLGVDVFAVQGKGYRLAEPLELLNAQDIAEGLGSSIANNTRLDVFPVLESTNRFLMQRLFEQGNHQARVCIADHQTAGRGRRGKQWVSPFGQNIYLSLQWQFSRGIGAIEGLSLVVGIALIDALQQSGVTGAAVKWPNDIYVDNRKLAGILIEMAGEASGACNVVIGIGLNVHMSRHQTPDIDQPWIDVAEILKQPVSRNQLSAQIINSLMHHLKIFSDSGFSAFKSQWHRYDLLQGQTVLVVDAQGHRHGQAVGIDESGALLIDNGTSVERVLSGEVSVRLPTSLS